MNECCRQSIARLQLKLADLAELCIKNAGERQTVMEEALYRRGEIIVDVMDVIKNWTNKGELDR